MRTLSGLFLMLAATATILISAPRADAQGAAQPQRGYQWSNGASNSPGWRSQHPLSAMTPGRADFTRNFQLGLNTTSGLTSNGGNLLLAEGELVQLDVRAQRFRVRASDQRELVLYYTSATQFLGTTTGVEGLAPASGRSVRVLYTQDAAIPNAVAIELLPSR